MIKSPRGYFAERSETANQITGGSGNQSSCQCLTQLCRKECQDVHVSEFGDFYDTIPPASVVLIVPEFPISSAGRFRSIDPQRERPMSPLDNNDDSAKARKRRIELRAGKGDDDTCQDSKRLCLDESQEPEGPVVPSLRGIKRQTRYEPGVPMTKDQLTTWRKEARRVRNRESAAASRHKTKERIDELEGQITKIQSKYEAALRRIAELEGQGSSYKSTAFPVPPRVSPQCSPKISPLHEHDSFSLDQFSDANLHTAASQLLLPSHDIYPSMISRPTAVCV
jgi:hypothetical protein